MKLKEVSTENVQSYGEVLSDINNERISSIKIAFADLYSGIQLCNVKMTEREYRRIEKKYFNINV